MATLVQIVIQLDNTKALAGADQVTASIRDIGVVGEEASEQLGTAMTNATAKIQQAVSPSAALNAEMRQMGMSSASAAAGITDIGRAASDTSARVARASAAMQQMVENMQAAQAKYAAAAQQQLLSSPQRMAGLGGGSYGFANFQTIQAQQRGGMVGDVFGFKNLPSEVGPADEAIQQFGSHMTTSLDSVRLFGQELGIRIPRAMETMLSRIPAVIGLLSGMLNAMLALGAIEIFARIAEGIYHVYEEWFNVTKAVEDYQVKAAEAGQTELFNTASIETANSLLAETSRRVDELQKKKDQAGVANVPGGGLLQYFAGAGAGGESYAGADATSQQATANVTFSAQDDKTLASNLALQATAQQRANELKHTGNLQQLQDRMAYDSAVSGSLGRIGAKESDSEKIAKANLDYTQQREQALERISQLNTKADPIKYPASQQAHADPTAGLAEYNEAINKARLDASAENIAASRHERDERIAAQNEAINSGLEGEARYTAQRKQAIDAITRQYLDGDISKQTADATTAAIAARFDNERAERLQQQWQQTQQIVRNAQQSGLTGAARIVADHDNQVQAINTDRTLDPENASARRVAAQTEEVQKLTALQDQYTDRVKAEIDSRTEAGLQGYAKIDAAQQRQINAATRDMTRNYGGKDVPPDVQAQGQKQLQDETTSIIAASNADRTRLAQQTQQQTLQMDREAAQAERRVRGEGLAGWVQDYQSAVAEIQTAQTEMRARIDADQQKTGGDTAPFEQQKVDADRVANAQILELNQQMSHQVAGMLQGAFDDPVRFIQNKMKEMFFQILADWLTQTETFKGLFGNSMSTLQPGGASGGSAASAGGISGFIAQHLGGHPAAAASSTRSSSTATSADIVSGTIDQAYIRPGATGTASISAGSPAIASASLGTIDHAYTAPAAFTAAPGSNSSSVAQLGAVQTTAARSAGVAPASVISGTSDLLKNGMSTAHTLSTLGAGSLSSSNASTADNVANLNPAGTDGGFAAAEAADTDAAWNDPTKVSSSVPGSGANSAYHGAAGSSGLSAGLGIVGAGVGAYTGTEGIISSFESGKASGILTGAESGAAMGASIGMLGGAPGAAIGATIGAVGGAVAGLVGWASGEGNRIQAQQYYKSTMQPQLAQEELAYGQGSGGTVYSALSEVNQTASQGYNYMIQKWGFDAAAWAKTSYIDPMVANITQDLEALGGAGHDYMAASAVQFHSGGVISGFGDFATSSNEGMIHAMLGETVMNPAASSAHAPYLSAANAGASPEDIAAMYLGSSSSGTAASASGGGDTHHHWNVSAVDAKSFKDMLVNGGGMDAISQAANKRVTRMASDVGGAI
ncbi:hypothetical protein FTO74_14435 [Granulicella sp. WH15]|uniref:hypothetical protein n=1 Tax=Granulicella sp. WH15 TaxID=2602070 RepID=UPI001366D941|nr:hypothetical protein [Granulicella sp. WH15]QHN04430.1 hypothetical protein FTO74_14435 [Granulicella sp. WH15]